jgi:coronin-1B/1C/6
VWNATDFKRFDANVPLIKGHQGAITDLMFSPFHNNLLASSSEDGKVKLWVIPEGGLTQHVKDEDMCLTGHTKKALSVRWHNSVENLIATSAIDNTVKIWDVSTGKTAHTQQY